VSEHGRRQAFVASALAVAAVVVLILSLDRPGPESPDQTTRARSAEARAAEASQDLRRAVILDAAEPRAEHRRQPRRRGHRMRRMEHDHSHGDPLPAPRRLPRAAERAAHRFVQTFLHYERGDVSPAQSRAIRSMAAPPLARALLSNLPRPPASGAWPPLGRLVHLGGGERIRGGAIELVAFLDRGGRRSSLLLTLAPRRDQWLITAIG